MSYYGYVDKIQGNVVKGWAVSSDGRKDFVVGILAGGTVVATTTAVLYRDDLKESGIGDGYHGFECEIPNHCITQSISARILDDGYVLISGLERGHRNHLESFIHTLANGIPNVHYGFSNATSRDVDVAISREIIAIWNCIKDTVPDEKRRDLTRSTIWSIHEKEKQKTFIDILDAGDENAVAAYLIRLPRADFSYGLLQSEEHYRCLISTTPEGRNAEAVAYLDLLISVAEYLALLPCETPFQQNWGRNIHTTRNEVRDLIEEAVGISIVPPECMDGLFGISFGGGILHRRHITSLYGAIRIRSTLLGRNDPTVCEIGGAAFYSNLLGIRKYVMVDLPIMCLIQFYCLKKLLKDVDVRLSLVPEGTDRSWEGVRILPTWRLADFEGGVFDLVFNMDGFPEMGEAVCEQYLAIIERRAKALLSINQEAGSPLATNPAGPKQALVPKVASRFPGFKRRYRFPSWVLKGYVEELYTVLGGNA